MYGSFEDFARYANDREMDTFGTQEFFDYHNAKRVADAGGGVLESLAEFGANNPVLQGLAGAISKINEYLDSIPSLGGPRQGLPPYTPSVTRYPALRMDGSYSMGGEEVIPYDLPPVVPQQDWTPDAVQLQMSPTLSAPADGVPADIAPLLEQSMGPVGEGVKVAAADTGTMSDAISGTMPNVISDSTRASINKLIARIPDNKDAVKTWEPTSLKDQYRLSLRDGLVALGFDEDSATRLANNVIGEQYLGYKGEGGLSSFKGGIRSLGVGDFEPVAVTHGGVQAIRRGLESGDNFEVAGGVIDMLFGGLPIYGKPLAKAVRGVIDVLGKRFGKTGPEAAKLDSAAGSLETPDGVVQQKSVPPKPSNKERK